MLNCGAWVGPLVLVGYLLPEHGAECVYISVESWEEDAGSHGKGTREADYEDDVGLSSQRDPCPALRQSHKPPGFPRQFLAAETSEQSWAALCVPLVRE